jgi:hypothetical protein
MKHVIKSIFAKPNSYAAISLCVIMASCDSSQSNNQAAAENTDTTTQVVQTSNAPAGAMLTESEKNEGWKLLFDGKSVEGWKAYKKAANEPTGWVVEDGMLTTPGGKGDIITVDQYDNFELAFEWKVEPKGNSGVMYLVKEGDSPRTYESGPEYQIIDDEGYVINASNPAEKLNETQKTGANYDIDPPSQKVAKPAGEFNQSRIIVKDGHVEHWLNGTKVVEYQLGSKEWKDKVQKSKFGKMKEYGASKKGHVALQDHGDQVWFRSIKIRQL